MQDNVWRRSRCCEMGNRVEAVLAGVGAGEHRNYARYFARRCRVDAADQCMCMRRPQCGGINLSGKVEIVAVTAAARNQAQVFLATYWVSDACSHGLMV